MVSDDLPQEELSDGSISICAIDSQIETKLRQVSIDNHGQHLLH